MDFEPLACKPRHLLQCTGLFDEVCRHEVCRHGDKHESPLAAELRERRPT